MFVGSSYLFDLELVGLDFVFCGSTNSVDPWRSTQFGCLQMLEQPVGCPVVFQAYLACGSRCHVGDVVVGVVVAVNMLGVCGFVAEDHTALVAHIFLAGVVCTCRCWCR